MIVRCENSECMNFGAAIDVGERPRHPETGEPMSTWIVVCGPCGSVLSGEASNDE